MPVLNRYDLLRQLLLSLKDSNEPFEVVILNNGLRPLNGTIADTVEPIRVMTPLYSWGVAQSWNWFIDHVPEERLIVNDDVTFMSDSLRRMATTPGDFLSALPGTNAFSCFLLRDSCVAKIGKFDETISPGYAYFEDCDYVERMIQARIPITQVAAEVAHGGSQTPAKYSQDQWTEHHRLFAIAKNNFITKWGAEPHELEARRREQMVLA